MTNRKKPSCWLPILILSGLGISVAPNQVLPRTTEVSKALSPLLSSYEVIRLEPGEIERQVRTTGELRLRFDGEDFYFNLEPHDLRAPGYRAEATGSGGVRRELPPRPVHTFKGVLAGREDTRGRFNLTDGGVEEWSNAPEGWVYVEPLRNHLPGASPGDLVVYGHEDLKPVEGFQCGVSLPERLQRGVEQVAAQTEVVPPTNYVADVATEADYEYVQAAGGVVEANREIEGILNQVEGVFQKELLVQLRLSFQHAWDMEEDPYTGATGERLLIELSSYWTEHFETEQDYDLVHLWTGKQDLGAAGNAAGRICYPGENYWAHSVSTRLTSISRKSHTPAHEIGHNFSARHPNELIPPVLACGGTIMVGGGGLPPGGYRQLTFCQFSRQQIAEYLSGHNSCLDTQPIPLQPPTGLSARAASASRIHLSWRDNSANETGFIVERRREGSGIWVQIGTTTADTEAFTSEGLFSEATYLHRVQAFIDSVSSAYSNEAAATTPAGTPIATGWRIDTIAGRTDDDGDNGPAIEARLAFPDDVAVDGSGAVYIADRDNHRIRRVDGAGTIITVAGTGESGFGGDGGPAVEAQLVEPRGVAVDEADNLYIADTGNRRVRQVDGAGTITTVAARLNGPGGVAVDEADNLYIADSWNHRVRRVDGAGIITTVAGTGVSGYSGDGGPAVEAQLAEPRGVAVDRWGNLYIADTGNHRIRRVDASGTITTVAGIGGAYDSGGSGPAAEAVLHYPQGVAVDGAGNLYIADTYNHRIRRVDSSGTLTTIAGTGVSGYGGDGGLAATAQLNHPTGVAVDEAGNVYVADSGNHRIRVLTRLPPPPGAPARLTATAVSPFRIDLSWRDNSDEEEGFRVQRRMEGSSQWVDIGATAADLTTYSDTGLEPATTYRYRVRAYRNLVASAFSNQAAATTPRVMPPTLTRFSPTSGPVGTRVTLAGTHFHGAAAVAFNGVPAARFDVVSGTRIEAVVPWEASSGPIRVVAPGGAVTSAESFTVTDSGIGSRLFVPIVLRSRGRTPGSFFTSELTLTNRGSSTAAIHYTYAASFGGGSGTAVDALGPGRQRVILDAIAYLTDLGVPIGSGSAGGTLAVDFSNLSSPSDAAVTVRVATPVKEGRAGLAYLGLTPDGLLTGPAFITGLRQNNQDRSNLAVQNAGVSGNGNITLRVTVYSGNPEAPGSLVLPDRFLEPGGFHQYNGILKEAGFDNGYVKVERVAGTAPFYAYGVINDQANSDGSFVFPVSESSVAGSMGQVLPVVVEAGPFTSELTVTNFSEEAKAVTFSMVADAIETEDHRVAFTLPLRPGQQYIIPNAIEEARQRFGINLPRGLAVPLFASAVGGDLSGVVMGARTGSQADPEDVSRGRYSVFYTAVPQGVGFTDSAWIYGLQQNAENRSNLALVNSGEVDDSPGIFSLEIYNGETGRRVRTITRTVPAQRWHQLDSILLNHGRGARQGYVRILKTSGNNPFLAYGVINDGGARGERSDDGAYVPARE